MYQEWTSVLSSSSLFRGVSPGALGIMLNCLKPGIKRFKQREIVAVCRQPFQGIGIVASGGVVLTKENASGSRVILEVLGPGDVFGETVAFSDTRVWPVTVIAQEDSCLLFLPPDKILGNCPNVCSSHSTLIMNMLNILSNRTLALNKKIEYLSAGSIRGRICTYLLDVYQQTGNSLIAIPMKRHELADYLGMPRPSLSRELGLMRDAGLIDFGGRSVKIRNVLMLEKQL